MISAEKDENADPSVDSNDPEERIAARRLRIQRRIAATRRSVQGTINADTKADVVEKLTKSREQMEASRLRLTKLIGDGTGLVSNIRVATDDRESLRRTNEEESKRQRKEQLEAEAKIGQEKFDEITKKWETSLQNEIPQDLNNMLQQQNKSCSAMIEDKNKLISEFQMSLKTRETEYVDALKKASEDADLLIARMEEQCRNLDVAYRKELELIEKAFEEQRKDQLEEQKDALTEAMDHRTQREVEYLENREKKVDEYEQLLQQQRTQDTDDYNANKRRLENDVMTLEQQLQQMRATYQLNAEKLEYNFSVLRKRDDENRNTIADQKRKITRLQDVLNNTRIKLAKQEKQFGGENSSLREDYERVTKLFNDLQRKSRHFLTTDAHKFEEIWLLNEETACSLADRCLAIDRALCEQQLGFIGWRPPVDTSFMQNKGPLSLQKASAGRSALHVAKNLLAGDIDQQTAVDSRYDTELDESALTATSSSHSQLQYPTRPAVPSSAAPAPPEIGSEAKRDIVLPDLASHTVKAVLELLADESEFLVESKLKKLLAPLERDEQNLMKLDAIFAALNIETEHDLREMARYFVDFREMTPVMIEQDGTIGDGDQDEEDVEFDANGVPFSRDRARQLTASKSGPRTQTGTSKLSDARAGTRGSKDTRPQQSTATGTGRNCTVPDEQPTPPPPEYECNLVDANNVFLALKRFVFDHAATSAVRDRKIAPFRLESVNQRDATADAEYWSKYVHVVNSGRSQLWNAIGTGLNHYLEELKQRNSTLSETDALKQQNTELRMLLQQYITSKVNQELEVPPTQTLQMQPSSDRR